MALLKIILILGICWQSKSENKIQVNGLVDSNEVMVGESFVYNLEIVSAESVEAQAPVPPKIDGVDIGNVTQSTSMSSKMVQGAGGWEFNTVRKTIFGYYMTPLKKGRLKIPPFSVVVAGKSYLTKEVTLDSVEAGQQGGRPRLNARPRGGLPGGFPDDSNDPMAEAEEMFNQLLQRRMGGLRGGQVPTEEPQMNMPGSKAPTLKNPNELFFISADVDKREAYEGEQILAAWHFYLRGNLVEWNRTKFPDLKGFWKEIIEEVPQLQFTQEVINGQVYRKALLASHALFPIKEGTSYIDSFEVKGKVQTSGGAFGMGGGQVMSFNRSSERIPIKVLPLPKEGRPSDFSGAVGDFTVQGILENNLVVAHQPLTYKIRFEGKGNAKLIELPAIDWPTSIEVIETKSDAKFFKNGQSYKQFDLTLIPRQEGEIKLPTISVSVFDPSIRKYVTKTIESSLLKVTPGVAPAPLMAGASGKAPKGILQKAGPYTELEARQGVNLSWILVALAYLAGVIGAAYKGWSLLVSEKPAKDYQKSLLKGIAKAQASAAKGDFRATGIQMVNLTNEIIGGIVGGKGVDQELIKALDQLPSSLRRELGVPLSKMVETFQSLSFAPEEILGDLKKSEQMKKELNSAQAILTKALELGRIQEEK